VFASSEDGRIQTAAEYLSSTYRNFDYRSPESFKFFDDPSSKSSKEGSESEADNLEEDFVPNKKSAPLTHTHTERETCWGWPP